MVEVRVLLADELAVARAGLRAMLAGRPGLEVVGEAGDPDEVLALAGSLRPDLMILGPSGGPRWAAALARLGRACAGARLLALAEEGGPSLARLAVDAGATGLLPGCATAEELDCAARVVAAGGVWLSACPAPGPASGGASAPSRREEQVLRLLALGYSNKQIAARLGVSVKTVETHKARGMGKLRLGDRAGLVRHALKQGWFRAENVEPARPADLAPLARH